MAAVHICRIYAAKGRDPSDCMVAAQALSREYSLWLCRLCRLPPGGCPAPSLSCKMHRRKRVQGLLSLLLSMHTVGHTWDSRKFFTILACDLVTGRAYLSLLYLYLHIYVYQSMHWPGPLLLLLPRVVIAEASVASVWRWVWSLGLEFGVRRGNKGNKCDECENMKCESSVLSRGEKRKKRQGWVGHRPAERSGDRREWRAREEGKSKKKETQKKTKERICMSRPTSWQYCRGLAKGRPSLLVGELCLTEPRQTIHSTEEVS